MDPEIAPFLRFLDPEFFCPFLQILAPETAVFLRFLDTETTSISTISVSRIFRPFLLDPETAVFL